MHAMLVRDRLFCFFSLIKMLYYMCEKTDLPPTWPQVEHAIRRNFGGMELDSFDPLSEFTKRIQMSHDPPDLSNVPPQVGGNYCFMIIYNNI